MGTVAKPNKPSGGADWVAGDTITASVLNATDDTIYGAVNGNLDNANVNASANILPTKIDDASSTLALMKTTSDPSGPTLPVTNQEEIRSIRFQLAAIINAFGSAVDFWYETPAPRLNQVTVSLTANFSIPDNVITPIDWNTEDEDTGGWWAVGNPSRITVPTGVTRIDLVASSTWASDPGGSQFVRVLKNSAAVVPSPITTEGTGVNQIAAISVPVVATDIIELAAFQPSGGAINMNGTAGLGHTWITVRDASHL